MGLLDLFRKKPTPEELSRARALLDYEEQAAQLQSQFEREKQPVFVAACQLGAESKYDKKSPRFTFCVWGSGVVAALPQAEWVSFVGDGWMGRAPWSRVQEVVGPLMKPMGLTPERYLVEQFPSREQLAAIGLEP